MTPHQSEASMFREALELIRDRPWLRNSQDPQWSAHFANLILKRAERLAQLPEFADE